MHALDVLGDPVRRRILEVIAEGEESAGAIAEVISAEFGISQPAVSQHLRVLREHGFATVRPEGTRRLYAVDPQGVREAAQWLTPFERFWRGPLAALETASLAVPARAGSPPSAVAAGPTSAPDPPSPPSASPARATAPPTPTTTRSDRWSTSRHRSTA